MGKLSRHLAIAAVATGLAAGCAGGGDGARSSPTSASADPTTTTTAPAPASGVDVIEPVEGLDITAGAGAVWTAGGADAPLTRIDTGSLDATTSSGEDAASGLGRVAFGEGALWAITGSALHRIDPETEEVTDTLEIDGRATDVAVGEGAVWVTVGETGAGHLIRVDPTDVEATDEIEVDRPASVAVGEGAVWVTSVLVHMLHRVDLETLEVTDSIVVDDRPFGVAVGFGSVWLASEGEGTLTQVDPAAVEVYRSVQVADTTSQVTAGSDRLWVAARSGEEGFALRIHPGTLDVEDHFATGTSAGSVVTSEGSAWVLNGADDRVTRIGEAAEGDGPLDEAELTSGPGELFADPGGLYRIRVDPAWEATAAPVLQAEGFLIPGTARANLALVTAPEPTTDPGTYIRAASDRLSALDPTTEIVATDTVTSEAGSELVSIEYTQSSGGRELHFLVLAEVGGGQSAAVTFTALESEFAEVRPEVEPFMRTLELLA